MSIIRKGFVFFSIASYLLFFLYFLSPFIVRLFVDIEITSFFQLMFKSIFGRTVFLFINIGIIYLWINNILFWKARDTKTKRLLLLIFIPFIYSPVYYLKRESIVQNK